MTTEPYARPEMPPYAESLAKAEALLAEGDTGFVVAKDALPNPFQGLWIFSYTGPNGEELDGGGIVVDADGARSLTSAPGADEYIGVEYPDDEDPEEDEMSAVVAAFGDD